MNVVQPGEDMRRREIIAGIVGAMAAEPFVAQAQSRPAHIGFLGLAPATAWTEQFDALRAGLKDLGYVEGQTFVIDFRLADNVDQLPTYAAELVSLNVDVIVAPASTEVEPARRATTAIPIVFAQHADPVGLGHVASLPHPGGNITGVSMVLPEIAAKALEILLDLIRGAERVAVLWNPTTPSHHEVLRSLERTAAKLDVRLVLTPASSVADFDDAFASMARERVQGFVVPSSPLTNSARDVLAQRELASRLPGIFVNRENVVAGGLMSYGADFNYMYRHTAVYIDKILKGAKPADLPVEQASKYQLVLNLKTAKALGLEIPQSIYARADQVIE